MSVRARLQGSLRNKLTLLFFCVTAGAVLIVYFYVVPQLESNLTSQKLDSLKQSSASANARFERAVRRPLVSITEIRSLVSLASQLTNTQVSLYQLRGGTEGGLEPLLLADSRNAGPRGQPSRSAVLEAARSGQPTSATSTPGRSLAQVARPVKLNGKVEWVVVYSEPLSDVTDNVSLIRRQFFVAGVLALAVAILVGYFFANALARRVNRLERAAADVARGHFSTPIPVESEDELGQLARAFNVMQRQLARVDDARKEFIANASHELRTPIFSLGGFVELLQSEEVDEATREEFLTTMREQVERLQKLTTELLDLSTLDAGELELELEPVSLRLLGQDVANEFAAAAARHGSQIAVLDGDGEDVEATCDRNRVEQILRVLLSNAITHTEPGTEITIETRVAAAGADAPTTKNLRRSMAELLVRDSGQGIPAAEVPHVFDRFHSGSTGQGSGLGLAIARELAQRMQGDLDLSSRPGETAFVLRLPLASEWTPPAPTSQRQPQPVGGGGSR